MSLQRSPANAIDWALFHDHGQGHLHAHWQDLTAEQRLDFERQLVSIHPPLLRQLFEKDNSANTTQASIEPPELLSLTAQPDDSLLLRYKQIGEQALRQGEVAVLMVAGGQGTRLGHHGPKGTFPIGPISGCSLFQLHAERLLALTRQFDRAIPLLIMTSTENDQATRSFWRAEDYFGLSPQHVHFFVQGMMPAVDAVTGQVLLSGPGQIGLSPNGHGGVLQALADHGLLGVLSKQGIRHLFYFQVDNPLVAIADPAFVGAHIDRHSEMSVKVVEKVDPHERIGLVVQRGGRCAVIEYTELTKEMAAERTEQGKLRWRAGNTAIHCFDLAFLQKLAGGTTMLPFHRAHKIMPFWSLEKMALTSPAQPNAYKFEMFIFDALPMAQRTLVMECERADEFEPLKNAEGEYSPATVRAALSERWARWLRKLGIAVPTDAQGCCVVPIEISPLFATDPNELARCWPADQKAVTGPVWLKREDQRLEF